MKKIITLTFMVGMLTGAALVPSLMRSSVTLTTPNVSTGSQPINDTGISVMKIEFNAVANTVTFTAPYGSETVAAGKTTAFASDTNIFNPVIVTISNIALTGTQSGAATYSTNTGKVGSLAAGSGAVTNLAADFKALANHANTLMLNGSIVAGTQNPW